MIFFIISGMYLCIMFTILMIDAAIVHAMEKLFDQYVENPCGWPTPFSATSNPSNLFRGGYA